MTRAGAVPLDHFLGAIAAGGFASGDQVVVGLWHTSPLGPFLDVMWVDGAGRRTLLAPNEVVREEVGAIYAFDHCRVVEVRGSFDGHRVEVHAGPLHLDLEVAPRDWRSWVFALRPAPLRRSTAWLRVEDRLARPLGRLLLGGTPGVRLAGVTPGGRREWYSVDDYRRVMGGRLTVDGRDAGPLTPLRADLGVGLSAFPTRPALVYVSTLLEPAD